MKKPDIVSITLIAVAITAMLALFLWAMAEEAPAHHGCHTKRCEARVYYKKWKREWRAQPVDWRRWALRTSACETHGIPKHKKQRATSPDGRYLGRMQFDLRTWAEAGGKGDPRDAGDLEQMVRGIRLARRPSGGKGRWPRCGR